MVDNLPVYNKARTLTLQFLESTKKAPINTKRGLIARTENALVSVMEHLAFADEMMAVPTSRAAFIRAAMRIMRKVKIRVRILYDLHFIRKSGFSALMLLEDDVMRQLQAWLNKTLTEKVEE